MQTSPNVMAKRRVGHTDLYVTPIGLGGATLGRVSECSDEQAVATVHHAIARGINLIDTSPLYRRSQRRIGLALEAWLAQGGKRKDLILSTKAGRCPEASDYSADAIRRSVRQSLDLLKTDYLDIVHVHDPVQVAPLLEPGGAFEALHRMKDSGLIRAVGLGMRDHAVLRRCIEAAVVDVVITYRDFNLMYQTAAADVLEPASSRRVGVFNAQAIIGGLLGGRDPQAIRDRLIGEWSDGEEIRRAEVLWAWARQRKVNLLALNLQFCLRERRITSTLVGADRIEQLDEDLAALVEPIPDQVWQALAADFALEVPGGADCSGNRSAPP